MKISKKSYYGLRAMVYLAKTKRRCSVNLIAKHENIPMDYLEKIFQELKKNDLIKAERGAQGGYSLFRSSKNITAGAVIKVLENRMAPVLCVAKEKRKHCPLEKACLTRNVWQKLQNAIYKTLNSITLADLIGNAK